VRDNHDLFIVSRQSLLQLSAMALSAYQQKIVLNLARSFIRDALQRTSRVLWGEQDPILKQPAGCFVSLHALQGHDLRGCVGRIDASQPLLEALRSASNQVLHDPRFANDPVRLNELPRLLIEVSVLSPPVPVTSPLDFQPLEHGIFLTIGNRTGCFLPQVARETGWTREQLLERLCSEKLGLPFNSWRNPQAVLHVFSVLVIGPEPFEPAAVGSNLKTLG
jgi:AmmeMemoRadiSam system protein A